MGLAVAPWSWFLTAWVAQIPLWLYARRRRNDQLLLGALAWGGGFYGLVLSWITGIHPMTWLGVPWLASLGIALFCWLAITLWGVVLVWFWLLGLALVEQRIIVLSRPWQTSLRLCWGTALWCALEHLWSGSILWWSPLAYTQSPTNLWLLQWGQLSGPTTLTAILVLINGLGAEMFWRYRYSGLSRLGLSQGLGLTFLLLLVVHGGGAYLAQRPLSDKTDEAIQVGLIQGNISNPIKLTPQGIQRALEGYTAGYQSLAKNGAAVILTPEGALPYFWEDIVANGPFYQTVLRTHVPVWLGAYGQQGQQNQDYTNSLFAIDGQGRLVGRYDKVKLVPLGEYIPLRTWLGGLVQRLSPLKGELVPGSEAQVFQTPFGPAAVSICYESAFPERLRRQIQQGATFILSSANNAHYSAAMPAQHHALDVLRAIENDRWLARATNTGYSAIISPRGETLWRSALNQYQLHQAPIYRRTTQTFYSRWGDWLTPCLLGLSGSITFLAWVMTKTNPGRR
ncbi:apolipoprotein N-acyltransferase [Synechocystis sp. LKSZ1]|uniref:apolipoprotein N-acyltransferase n=1 Tax=Synechocystis sp. LKSZ1 TaxID=3144951 RepID=UPI00336BE956